MDHPSVPKDLAKQRMEERARQLADAVVDAFTTKIKSEIEKHGGYLGLRHVDALTDELQAKARQLSTLFAQALEDAAREQDELRWHAIKRPAFDRLMVKRFETLFIHREADHAMHGVLSRRCLPGFFLALSMMLGPEAMEAFHRRCDAAVERIMGGQLPVDWNLVDQDAGAREVVLDAQYTIAGYFDEPARRFEWFMHIVNSHLAPTKSDHDPDANWELTSGAMQLLAQNLLSDLSETVHDDAAWNRLAARHPGADRAKMKTILDRLK